MPRRARSTREFPAKAIIYSLGRMDRRFSIRDADVYYSPEGHGDIYELQTSQEQIVWRNERDSGGVYFESGAQAFGIGLGVTMAGSHASDNTVRIEFLPIPELTRFKVWFVQGETGAKGQSQAGLIGMVSEIPMETP
jgi:hypothetical protein